MGRRKSPYEQSILILCSLVIFLISSTFPLEFRGKYNYEIDRGRNIKFQLTKNRVSVEGRTTNEGGGLVLDRPKISILSYRVKNNDPWTILDELSCSSSLAGGRSYCDDIIELDKSSKGPLRLGQGPGEEAEWTVPPNVTNIVIKCTSKSGPVEWDYEGNGIFPELDIDTTRQTGDFWTPTTYTHESRLVLNKVTDQLTGTFSCRNVDRVQVSNSFYLFVPQEKLEVFSETQKIEIVPASHSIELVIPCRLNSSLETSVYLYKRMPDNGSLRKINMNKGVRYDPYVGFYLPVTRDIQGHYVCKVDKKFVPKEESSRKKRQVSLFMDPPLPSPETSTSPGISAFPTSAELLEMPLPIHSQEQLMQETYIQQRRRRKKHPVFMSRRGDSSSQIFHRRGGPPPPPHRIPPRRPLFRRRPPMHLIRPFSSPPQHTRLPPYFSQSHSSIHSQNDSDPLNLPQNEYMYPSPVVHHSSFPPPSKPIKTLPSFVHKLQQKLRPFSAEEKYPQQSEELSSGESSLSTRLDNNVTKTRTKPPRRAASTILQQNLLPQTLNIMNSMSCVLKKVILGPDAPCNGSLLEDVASINRRKPSSQATELISSNLGGGNEGGFGVIHSFGSHNKGQHQQQTILEVDILSPPENKFLPKESVMYTTVPFFVKWQTRFTDYADWAQVNHTLKQGTFKRHKAGVFEDGVNSFEVFNLAEGESGKISVAFMGRNKEILTHSWKFFIVNNTVYNAKGLTHKEEDGVNTFTCRTTSANKPEIKMTRLTDEGCPFKSDEDEEESSLVNRKQKFKSGQKEIKEEDCGPGCVNLVTQFDYGIVHCSGDGVDEKIRFPVNSYCTGRPYFIERGKTKNLTIEEKQQTLLIPCVINNPNADVYLFRQTLNETIEEVTEQALYDLKSGFRLDLEKVKEPLGTYVCTSTTDLEDETDMVTYHVTLASKYIFHPKNDQVFGIPPFKFVWESNEELEIENKSTGNYYSGMFAKPTGNRPYVGTFDITSLEEGKSGEISLVRSSDKEVVHTWNYKNTGNSRKPGLWLDKEKNVFRCRSSSDESPTLFPVECPNPNVCKFKKRFNEDGESGRDNSFCGDGCVQLKIWGNNPTGFVKCKGNGVDETLTYFLASNSTLVTEKDDLEIFKLPEITNVVRKLRVGETSNFVCRASKYFYSKGFQWAIETRSGSKRFVDLKTKEDDDSYLNEIRSEISLKVMDQDWKAVWCFAPNFNSNQWANVSQPIYIKN